MKIKQNENKETNEEAKRQQKKHRKQGNTLSSQSYRCAPHYIHNIRVHIMFYIIFIYCLFFHRLTLECKERNPHVFCEIYEKCKHAVFEHPVWHLSYRFLNLRSMRSACVSVLQLTAISQRRNSKRNRVHDKITWRQIKM